MVLHKIGKISDFKDGVGKLFIIEGKEIAVFKIDDKFYAIDERCSHEFGPLHEGEVEDTVVTCPLHGAQFDLKTGKVLSLPAIEDLNVYNVVVNGDEVFIEI